MTDVKADERAEDREYEACMQGLGGDPTLAEEVVARIAFHGAWTYRKQQADEALALAKIRAEETTRAAICAYLRKNGHSSLAGDIEHLDFDS